MRNGFIIFWNPGISNPSYVKQQVMSKHTNATTVRANSTALSRQLVEQALTKLELQRRPEPTLEGLHTLYATWCRHVPFDNVRKIIHVRSGDAGPLPGSTPEDFFAAWLKYGTGGTCWSGAGALQALLTALGFDAVRGIATMLAAPDLPPNHGTVRVTFGGACYLVDSAMLCVQPLRLESNQETAVVHPAWGLRCSQKNDHWYVQWRPLHKVDGFECRLEHFGAEAGEFQTKYENTRGWSPFNYEVTARVNRQDSVVGTAFGHAVKLNNDGSVSRKPINHAERVRLLIEDIGMSEEIVRQLPEDVPTPPPPWSRTAQAAS